MTTFVESRLRFDFDDGWNVVQWDDHLAYRGAGGFQELGGTLACDFIAVRQQVGAYFIEVKNFIGFHGANKDKPESENWAVELAGKVRDTLSGIIWTCGRSGDRPPLRGLIREALNEFSRDHPTLTVVLWIDDLPPLSPFAASSLRTAVQRQLRVWFRIRDVQVLSSTLLSRDPSQFPGLSVTRLT